MAACDMVLLWIPTAGVLSWESMEETISFFVHATMSRTFENVAQPGVLTSSLDGKFVESVEGIYFPGPEHGTDSLDSGTGPEVHGIVEDRSAAADGPKLPAVPREHHVQAAEWTFIMFAS